MTREFPEMVNVIPEGQRGEVLVEHFTFTEEESQFTRLRAAIGHPHEFCKPGRYARLRLGRKIWMTDTSMEREACRDVLLEAPMITEVVPCLYGDLTQAARGHGVTRRLP